MNLTIWSRVTQNLLLGADESGVKLGMALISDKLSVAYWRYLDEKGCECFDLPCIIDYTEDWLIKKVLKEHYMNIFVQGAKTSYAQGRTHLKKCRNYGHLE